MQDKELIGLALGAVKNSYSPYSGFRVGAALLCGSGRVYSGCNAENAAYSACICAERAAASAAVSAGEREFKAIAVVGGDGGEITDFCPPCGECRQVLGEFAAKDFKILLFNGSEIKTLGMGEILPYGFGRDKLCR